MSASERIRELLAELRQAMSERDEYRAEWVPVLSRYEALCERVETIQRELAAAMAETGIDLAESADLSLSVTLVRQDRGQYDPDKLPPQVRSYPGVLRVTVDRSALERAVRAGIVDPREVEAAWVAKPAQPYVRVKVLNEVT